MHSGTQRRRSLADHIVAHRATVPGSGRMRVWRNGDGRGGGPARPRAHASAAGATRRLRCDGRTAPCPPQDPRRGADRRRRQHWQHTGGGPGWSARLAPVRWRRPSRMRCSCPARWRPCATPASTPSERRQRGAPHQSPSPWRRCWLDALARVSRHAPPTDFIAAGPTHVRHRSTTTATGPDLRPERAPPG